MENLEQPVDSAHCDNSVNAITQQLFWWLGENENKIVEQLEETIVMVKNEATDLAMTLYCAKIQKIY